MLNASLLPGGGQKQKGQLRVSSQRTGHACPGHSESETQVQKEASCHEREGSRANRW
eukprot:evm.model.NODE_26504_length_4946_cov_11.467650.1